VISRGSNPSSQFVIVAFSNSAFWKKQKLVGDAIKEAQLKNTSFASTATQNLKLIRKILTLISKTTILLRLFGVSFRDKSRQCLSEDLRCFLRKLFHKKSITLHEKTLNPLFSIHSKVIKRLSPASTQRVPIAKHI
jgi:hypothetical protein